MKPFILLLVITFFITPVFAQNSESDITLTRNAFFVELGGMGGVYSLNYERLLSKTSPTQLRFRVGVAGLSNYQSVISGIARYWGNGKHHLEAGLGAMLVRHYISIAAPNDFSRIGEKTVSLNFSPQLGYRYQKQASGVILRAMFTPWFGLREQSKDIVISPWGGVSIGKSF